MNYEKDLEIDRDSLDQEWLKQPQLYFKYARESEDLQDEVEKLKEKLDILDAEIEKEIREDAKESGNKITEKAIASEILINENHKQLNERYLEKKHESKILSKAAVPAIEQRKSALENLVKLYCAGYWAEPREPKDSKFEEKAIDKAETKQRKTLNKRRKVNGKKT